MIVGFYLNPGGDILYKNIEGLVGINELIKTWEKTFEILDDLPDVRWIVSDYSNAKSFGNISDIEKIVDYFKEQHIKLQKYILATILSSPKTTAIGMIFNNKISSVLCTEIFSKKETAFSWAGVTSENINFQKIHDFLIE